MLWDAYLTTRRDNRSKGRVLVEPLPGTTILTSGAEEYPSNLLKRGKFYGGDEIGVLFFDCNVFMGILLNTFTMSIFLEGFVVHRKGY